MKTKAAKLKCRECGGDEDVIDELCAACEEDFTYCNACGEWFNNESTWCRHIFWDDCGVGGAGAHDTDWPYFREPFRAFLDVMTRTQCPDLDDYPDLVTAIEVEVGKDAFWTKLCGFMLSTPTLYFYRLRPDLPNIEPGTGLSFARIDRGDIDDDSPDSDESEAARGFRWLQSLCAEETREANAVTVRWIREWRQAQSAGDGRP